MIRMQNRNPRRIKSRYGLRRRLGIALACVLSGATLFAQETANNPVLNNNTGVDINKIRIEQKMGSQIPLDLTFRDESGKTVALRSYFKDKPVVLVMAYYECPMLCTVVLNELTRVMKSEKRYSIGKDYEVITVSISPTETPELAAKKKENYVNSYQRTGGKSGWHFLVGDEANINQLADSVGFNYVYDPKTKQYAHSAGVMILTPEGKLARYLLGIDYTAKDLRFALIESSKNKIGNPVEQVILYCYQYDPSTGRYGLVIMRVVQLAGILTVLSLGTFIFMMVRAERHRSRMLNKE